MLWQHPDCGGSTFAQRDDLFMRLLFIFISVMFGATAFPQAKPKVVIVIADGIPADVIERLRPAALMEIAHAGFYTRAFVGGGRGDYTETPTISAPGYTDLFTGTWGYKHNVWDNGHQHPNYHYPTLFRLLKTARPESRTAIFSTWTDNRTVLLGAGLPQTDYLKIDDVYDGYELDTLQYPHDRRRNYIHQIDERVIAEADSVIRTKAPDLSWIYLEYTDDIGHGTGTGVLFDSAVLLLDGQMKKIRDAIRFRELTSNENWLLVITTDHGRDSVTGRNHGGQSDRERTTWMILNQPDSNRYVSTSGAAIVDIYPTAAHFLRIPLPLDLTEELDGIPLTGPVSVGDPQLLVSGDTLTLHWKSYQPGETVKISVSYTNHFKTGGDDHYQFLATIPAQQEVYQTVIPGLAARGFCKIFLKGKSNATNRWWMAGAPPVK